MTYMSANGCNAMLSRFNLLSFAENIILRESHLLVTNFINDFKCLNHINILKKTHYLRFAHNIV